MRNMLKSKIHRARITGLCVDYEGSITIDKTLLEEADILPYEQVEVLNINNAARFATYVIEGERDSGEICINGAAARLARKGDKVIIVSYSQMTDEEAKNHLPKLVGVDEKNHIASIKQTIDALPF